MTNLKNLLGSLWNSKQDSYSESKHPVLQKIIDSIKDKYIKFEIEKRYYKVIEMDTHLACRKTNHLMEKLYNKSI